MSSKSNQIFCKDILYILYKGDPLQFLLDLDQFSFKYFAISFAVDSIIISWYQEHILVTKYLKEIWRWRIRIFTGKKIFTKLIFGSYGNIS